MKKLGGRLVAIVYLVLLFICCRDLFDNPGDIEERNDDNGHGTENTQPVGHSRTSTYFKTYAIIEGTQKTHDSAILEAVLERMTMKQVLHIIIVMVVNQNLCREGGVRSN